MPFNEILLFLANNDFTYKYILLFYILSLICIALPIPYTFVIISNAYVFGWMGFFLVVIAIPPGSLITYLLIKKFYFIIEKSKLNNFFFKKKINLKFKFYNNTFVLLFARATLPFFLVSVLMSLIKIPLKKYLFLTTMGTFVNVFLYSMFVISIRDTIINYNDIIINWKDPKFILSLLLLIIFGFVYKKIESNIKNNKKL
jgi:uncharacterized membrane protein YdjX (TVP38/TMEM64 family)|tara:strand:+ start:1356 stop:1955 length:600 start_codon:yes stop_codon:yes gene_type:complete